MNRSHDDEWLDNILSGDNDHIDDDGFTDAVMQGLPHRRQDRKMRSIILGCATVLSIIILLLSISSPMFLFVQAVEYLYALPSPALAASTILLYSSIGLLTHWLINLDR
jgi:hypothetical protein